MLALPARREARQLRPFAHLTLHTLFVEVLQIQGSKLLLHMSCASAPTEINMIVADQLLIPLTDPALLIGDQTLEQHED